jgi:threonine dehydrogenase-like Zn-dependent dehydrogenase
VSRPRLAAGLASCDDVPEAVRELTDGRGTDSVIDAVGMEAHGTKSAGLAQKAVDLLPDAVATAVMKRTGVDRLQALTQSIERAAAERSPSSASTVARPIR